jgi:hypothetical protein
VEPELRDEAERRLVAGALRDLCLRGHPPRVPQETLADVLGGRLEECAALVERVRAHRGDHPMPLRPQEAEMVARALELRLDGPYALSRGTFHTLFGAWPEAADALVDRLRGRETPPSPPVRVDRATLVDVARDLNMLERYLRRLSAASPDDPRAGPDLMAFVRDVGAADRLARARDVLNDALVADAPPADAAGDRGAKPPFW